MEFEITQSVAAGRKAVVGAVIDPRLYESIGATKGLAPPAVLERRDDGDFVRLRIRYGFDGKLSGAARAVLDPAKMTWVVELKVDPAKYRAKYRMLPDHYPDRIECRGSYRFDEEDDGTEQIMKGRSRRARSAGCWRRRALDRLRVARPHGRAGERDREVSRRLGQQ